MALCRIDNAFVNAEEDFAARFLRALDLKIISRNSRVNGAEIDLLCLSPQTQEYSIFEVKKRRGRSASGFPMVTLAQRRRLENAARKMQQRAGRFLNVRICLMLIDVANQSVEIVPDIVGA